MQTTDTHRHFFRLTVQEKNEPFNNFIKRLRTQAQHCDFDDVDSQLKSQIIEHCRSIKLRDIALQGEMSLNQIIDLGKALEKQYFNRINKVVCNRCGYKGHDFKNPNCRALRNICSYCNKRGHFTKMCSSKRNASYMKEECENVPHKKMRLSPQNSLTPSSSTSEMKIVNKNEMVESHSYPITGQNVIKPLNVLPKIPKKDVLSHQQSNDESLSKNKSSHPLKTITKDKSK
jgi:hypothetical protein